jgi:hypothetical protein
MLDTDHKLRAEQPKAIRAERCQPACALCPGVAPGGSRSVSANPNRRLVQQSANFDVHDTRHESRHQKINQREAQAEDRSLFMNVVDAYLSIRGLPVLCAMNLDEDAPRPRKWTPQSCHFIVDVENATAAALKDPIEQAAWFELASGGTAPAAVALRVISRCARFYRARSLSPESYFRPPMRRGHSATARL